MISGYLGKSDIFDRSRVSSVRTYADLNEHDHAALQDAVKQGRIKAVADPKVG